MKLKTLSIRMPIEVVESLRAEAAKEVRSINQLLTVILRDRYKAHAPPPTNPTLSQLANAEDESWIAHRDKQSQPANASRASRKNNTIN